MKQLLIKTPKWIFFFIGIAAGAVMMFAFVRWAPTVRGIQSRPFAFIQTTGTGSIAGINGEAARNFDQEDLDFKEFWDVWKTVKEKYYEQPIKDKDLFYGAIAGMVGGIGDPYTAFFEPKVATEFEESLSGKFSGIGAELGLKDGVLQIVAPLPETPAERAGIMAGDLIVKIDDTDTTGMSVEKAVTLIRGEKGTAVRLTLYRPNANKEPFEVKIVRDEIQVKSVRWKMLPSNIGVIEVTHFNEDTEDGFDEAVRAMLRERPKGIILDLRNDPGGFLQTAQVVAGAWVGDGVVAKERKQGKIIEVLRGIGRARLKDVPTVVLVNQGSASAAEIVAGALQDNGLATIVGTKTFGKGSVQDYQTLPDGSGLKITIAEWITPKEKTIHKTGLVPDFTVELTPDDYAAKRDPQLDRAVAILTGAAPAAAAANGSSATSARP